MDIMWNFLQDPLHSPCNRHCGRPGLAWHLKTQVWGLTPKLPHAAVPLVVVWAGGSTITLIQSVARGKVGALGSASRVGFVVTMRPGETQPFPKPR